MSGSTRTEALHGAVLEACFGTLDEASTDLAGFLGRHGVDARDQDALLAAPRRLALYRKLVRGNVTSVCEAILERGHAHLEHLSRGLWDAAIDAYLASGGPRTPHLRDVPGELLSVLLPRVVQDARIPAYVADLFRLELAELTIGAHPDLPVPTDLEELDAERPVLLRGPSQRLRATFAVHEASNDPCTPPEARDTRLFVYRNPSQDVMVVVLSPFADELLERLLLGETLGASIGGAAAALGVPITEPLLAEVAKWLADFGERGVLLGAGG